MKFKAIYEMWSWTSAIRFNADENASILTDKKTPFTVIPNSKRYWTADPFLFEKDGVLYLFFEAFDIFKRKGLLGYRTVENGHFGEIHIFYEHPTHLSFPFIYEDNGTVYVIPESAKSNELFRLKCTHFPDKWEKETVLLCDKVVDTVRYVSEGTEYYISERVIEDSVYDRVDLYYMKDGILQACEGNPLKTDASCARGAGAVCKIGGKIIRPAQDCATSYGEKLNLCELQEINTGCFREQVLDTFSFRDIRLSQNLRIDGIHTYNRLGNIEVIDLRIPGKFNLRYTLGFFSKALKKIFH